MVMGCFSGKRGADGRTAVATGFSVVLSVVGPPSPSDVVEDSSMFVSDLLI